METEVITSSINTHFSSIKVLLLYEKSLCHRNVFDLNSSENLFLKVKRVWENICAYGNTFICAHNSKILSNDSVH